MSAPYHVIEAEVAAHGRLWLRFADGASGELDVIDRLRGPVFEITRTEAGFAQQARLDEIAAADAAA
jgi:hypothetical protein